MRTRAKQPDVIAELRALTPRRALSWTEEISIAERQATRLLALIHIDEPPIPQFVISALPGIFVERRPGWPTSGMTAGNHKGWRIVLSADEPLWRQRFSLGHEFKHVLDDPFIDRLHRHLPEGDRRARAERISNAFAACLLMPRAWIKRDWCAGRQSLHELTRRYGVSTEAMAIRLAELGLYSPIESTT